MAGSQFAALAAVFTQIGWCSQHDAGGCGVCAIARGLPTGVGSRVLSRVRLKRRWPRRLTSAPASVDTVAAFRPWRGFRPSVARGRRGHHGDCPGLLSARVVDRALPAARCIAPDAGRVRRGPRKSEAQVYMLCATKSPHPATMSCNQCPRMRPNNPAGFCGAVEGGGASPAGSA